MLWPYLKIWQWELIFVRAVKAISSLGVCSPWIMGWNFWYKLPWHYILILKLTRCCHLHSTCAIWQYGLWSFQTGGTKLERFLPKNPHTQRKLLNFEFWISGELPKSDRIWLSKIFHNENHSNLSHLRNTNLGAHFLLLIFFDKVNF